MARYGQKFKDKAVARLLPPEGASVEAVSQELSISVATLERWRAQALSRPARERAGTPAGPGEGGGAPARPRPARERAWTAAARFEAVLATAALDEAGKSAWCRQNGLYPQDLAQWRAAATEALAEPEEARASSRETKADRRRIKELERDLRRKDKALAETAALLVLSKKLEVIFPRDKDEDA